MKQTKKIGLLIGIAVLSLQLVACNQTTNTPSPEATKAPVVLNLDNPTTFEEVFAADEIDTFTNAGGTFSIDLPKEWLQDKSADKDQLVTAQDEGMTMSVMITKYTKGSAMLTEMEGEGIDAFVKLYEEKGIPKLLSMATHTDLEAISLANFDTARGYEMAFSADDIDNKAYFAFVEGQDAYYAVSISGKADAYEANGAAYKGTLNTFKEF